MFWGWWALCLQGLGNPSKCFMRCLVPFAASHPSFDSRCCVRWQQKETQKNSYHSKLRGSQAPATIKKELLLASWLLPELNELNSVAITDLYSIPGRCKVLHEMDALGAQPPGRGLAMCLRRVTCRPLRIYYTMFQVGKDRSDRLLQSDWLKSQGWPRFTLTVSSSSP